MGRRTLIALAIALLALVPITIAARAVSSSAAIPAHAMASAVEAPAQLAAETGTPTPAPVAAAESPRPTISLAGASGETFQGRIERVRHSQVGSRVAEFPVGAYARKNVIIIQVESLNQFLINRKYGGREITPNLNKLIKESWYWPNAFSETGLGNTVDAEYTSNTSLYAPHGQASSVKYANRRVPALPRILKGLGYDTFTIHPNTAVYWNRAQLYQSLGFARYYDYNYFRGAKKMGPFGASDQELFKRGMKVLTSEASGTPFYAQFITMSAHGPFTSIPQSKRPLKTPKSLSGSLMGNYISAESYSDLAIGEFIAGLKKNGLWDKSIVVIYGDHTAMTSNSLTGKNAAGARKLLGRNYRAVDRQRIPLIVHLPGQATPVLRTDVAGQVDIMPTVADLLGADLTHVPHVGRSLYVASSPLVPLNAYLRTGSFLNSRVLVVPRSGSSKAAARTVTNGSVTGLRAADKSDASRVRTLMALSDKWVMSLPAYRPKAKKGWIPDPVARRAAKKYGFTQH